MLTTEAKNYILEYGFDANYIALGTDTEEETPADVTLGTETLRIPTIDSRYLNKLYFTAIIPPQMPSTTYSEIGLYRKGKLTKDSGKLLSRRVEELTKAANTGYLVRYIFEFTGFTDIQ